MSEDELFHHRPDQDLLIIDGCNHCTPDDVEATIQEVSGGRVAAIAVADDNSEKLVYRRVQEPRHYR